MNLKLLNKNIVVIGATGLIGSKTCESICENGGDLVLFDINKEKCNHLFQNLKKKYNNEIRCFFGDVGKKNDVVKLLKFITKKNKKIDGLINIQQYTSKKFFKNFESFDESEFDKIINVNLKGTFNTCQIIGSYMADNKGGSIINFASTYSIVAPNMNLYKGTNMNSPAAYSASKGGIMALTKYLGVYWAKKNLRVNQITPHGVYKNHDKKFIKNFNNLSPMGRMSKNNEVTGAIIFLLSNDSSYITSQNIIVDGGWSSW